MIYVNIILVVLFFLAWNEYDFIIFQKRFSIVNWFTKKDTTFYHWYFTNNWQLDNWWTKNVFAFLRDGLHLNSSIFRFIGFFFFTQLVFGFNWLMIISAIGLYAVAGAIHSIMNKTL